MKKLFNSIKEFLNVMLDIILLKPDISFVNILYSIALTGVYTNNWYIGFGVYDVLVINILLGLFWFFRLGKLNLVDKLERVAFALFTIQLFSGLFLAILFIPMVFIDKLFVVKFTIATLSIFLGATMGSGFLYL